jgi:hypothetical protein
MENKIVEFGSPEFWVMYDEFCKPESLTNLVKVRQYEPAKEMRKITVAAHRTRAIHTLKRPERGWEHHHAWLSLAAAPILNHAGNVCMTMRAGDVIVVEHGWDRDVLTTHSPIEEFVCGYLLSGKWDDMVGLFLPLFDAPTIMHCINVRLEENMREAKTRALTQSEDWGWYKK